MKLLARWTSRTAESDEAVIAALDTGVAPDLKKEAMSGVRWIAVSQLVAQVGSLGASIVLARLLTPAQFGEAAIAVILLPISILLSFGGFGVAVVQYRKIDAVLVRSAGTMSILCGALETIAIFLLAPLFAKPLFGGATSALIQLISPVFFLGGLGVVPRALLQRQLRFQRLAVIDMVGLTGGTAVSLALVIGGLGASGIVLGALATAAISRLCMVASAPWLGFGWNGARNREIVRFGLPSSLTSLAFWARQNADYAIVGATLGSTATGLYWRAFQWGVGYQSQLSGIMARVAFPILSRSEDKGDMLELRGRMTRVTNVMLFPMLAVIIATAPVLIPWLFGSAWVGAVVPTQILAAAGLASCAIANHIQVMLAAGHPREVMKLQVLSLAALVALCLAAVPYGVVGVCVAMAILQVAMVFAVYRYLLRGVLGLPGSVLRTDLLPAAVPAVILLAVAFPMTELLRAVHLPAFLTLASVSAVGVAVYWLALRLLFPSALQDASKLIVGVMPSRLRNVVGRAQTRAWPLRSMTKGA